MYREDAQLDVRSVQQQSVLPLYSKSSTDIVQQASFVLSLMTVKETFLCGTRVRYLPVMLCLDVD